MSELDDLLREISDNDPCGPDLTYDADFLALETLAKGKPEQQFGDTVIAAEPPDWRQVERRAVELLSRTKDIRLAVLLCRAWVNRTGISGMALGMEFVCNLLERYWDVVHPLPEDGDFFMRMNAVTSLNDITGLLRDLRSAEFLRSSAIALSVREAEAVVRGIAAEVTSKMPEEQIRLVVKDALVRQEPAILAVAAIRSSVARLDALCSSKLSAVQRPELNNLQSLFSTLAELIPPVDSITETDAESETDSEQAAVSANMPSGQSELAASPPRGNLCDRDDAIKRLLEISEFIEQTEPTNPAPMLIRRAARLMDMGFMDILRELSPDSVSQVENIIVGRGGS